MAKRSKPAQADYTVSEAAALLGLTTGRIRTLCIQHDIGKLRGPRLRLLSPADVERLRTIRKPGGRPMKAE